MQFLRQVQHIDIPSVRSSCLHTSAAMIVLQASQFSFYYMETYFFLYGLAFDSSIAINIH